MSWCLQRCSTCAIKVKKECWAGAQECTAIQACHAGYLSFADLDLSDSLLLVFFCREALYKDNQSSSGAPEEELGGEFYGLHHLEFPDEAVEVGDWIYATTLHLLLSIKEIQTSQTTSQQLAQAFATNSLSWAFWDVVLQYLHNFEDVL
ncbi:hypothetical protein C0993_005641 [Termitomyces sp. T159_Od127]|nr:hypothetical protein C0993_005641 [Termitomyces sp. T159_Od127]